MTAALLVATTVCCLAYLAAARRLRARGDRWPLGRDLAFCAGGTVLVTGWAAPWHGWPPFTGHMVSHLAAGMAAPLLLVLGRPVTLALRVLLVAPRRRLLSCVRSRAAAVPLWPPVAAAVHIGGLWAVYRTPLFAAAHHRPWLHALVYVHFLLSGALFTLAVLAVEPLRHRSTHALRGGALLAAAAAHGILAKSLYVTGPPGLPGTEITETDLHTASRVMYYGGDLTGIALAALLALQWYAAGGRALARAAQVRAAPRRRRGEADTVR
ncbi:cytochrome c oxidase assembly protein [Streptomyces sp. NPDC059002]|uniref:cytochrome c oxidase assembly protein n=1 Tax=Streptomyces sp. NPDC059002 TaxID=3346690 RepID=UPI003691DF92